MATLRAGAIPFYIDENGEVQMFFMKPSDPMYGGPDFQVAKGKVDENESFFDAGIREATEELGLKTHNIEDVMRLGHYLHTITMFVAKITDPKDFNDPDYETGETRWMTVREFYSDGGRDLHMDMVQDAYSLIRKHYFTEDGVPIR